MNQKRTIYIILISALIFILLFISFLYLKTSVSTSPDISITTINYVSHISEANRKVIDMFNEKYKGRIKVEPINLPFEKFSTNERKELLARYLRSKSDRIDIFTVDQIWVPRFAKWALQLDKYFNEKEESRLLDYGKQTCFYNNKLVAVPLYIDIALMFYRIDLINNRPDSEILKSEINNSITWEELIKLNSQTEQNISPLYLFPADSYEGLMCQFVEMMESQGKPLIENGKLQLNSLEAKKSLQLMIDLVNKYKTSPGEIVNYRENECYKTFLKDNGLFLRGWPAFLTEYPELAKNNKLSSLIKIAPTPHFRNGKSVSTFGGWNLMISKFSPHIEEAIIFMKYLVSEEAQSILYNEGNYLPINNLLYEQDSNKELGFYKHLMKSGVHRPFLENYTKISDIIVEYLNKALKGEITAEQALENAEMKIYLENIEVK